MDASQHTPDTDTALRACSYGSWYPRYASLAPSSRVISLDAAFVDFLHEDGLVLPPESDALPQRAKPSDIIVEGVDYDPDDLYSSDSSSSGWDAGATDNDNSSSSDDDDNDAQQQQPWPQRFPALHASIAGAMAELGGSVAPRLNWSSPVDALWLSSSNSLKCGNADEVMLLLKGSDRVAHDLDLLAHINNSDSSSRSQQQQQATSTSGAASQQHQPHQQQAPLPAELVLRAWVPLAPEWQFRVFVHNHAVAAVSQRDPSQHFPQLAGLCGSSSSSSDSSSSGSQQEQEEQQEEQQLQDGIQARVLAFHRSHIGSSFPLQDYVYDLYVPPRARLQLLDFSPICSTTSPLCFDWEELPYTHMKQQQQHEQEQQPSQQQPDPQPPQQPQSQPQQQQQEEEDAAGCDTSRHAAGDVLFRVVEHEGMIVPGSRVATGMPYDILGLPDALSSVMAAMQQQQLQ